MKRLIVILMLGVGVFFYAAEAHSVVLQKPFTIQELSEQSLLIVLGTVTKLESSWNPERTKIFTFAEVEVEDYVKGHGGKTVSIRIPGGRADGITEIHAGMSTLCAGAKFLLFLNPGHPYSDIVGASQGKYRIIDGQVLEQEIPVGEFVWRIKGLTDGEPGESATAGSGFLREEFLFGEALEPDELPTPVITGISPSSASAGTNSTVTISGYDFGSEKGSVCFRATGPIHATGTCLPAAILSWADTQIKCTVPVDSVDYYLYSAGSFDTAVQVATEDRVPSADYPFTVTFGYSGYRWPSLSVSYYINENSYGSGGDTAIKSAANSWNGHSNLNLGYAGATNSSSYGYNGKNEFIWQNMDYYGVIAETVYWLDPYGNVVEVDTVFNSAFYWSTSDSPLPYVFDVQTIALHELGHWLVLLDLFGDLDTSKVMYGINTGEIRRTLTAADVAGIQYIYGAPGTETVYRPRIVDGPESGFTGVSYDFSTGNSFSTQSHPIEYLFDWGDGTDSGWSSDATGVQKSWDIAGNFDVRVKTRCAMDTSLESEWSEIRTVRIKRSGPDLTGSWLYPFTQTCQSGKKSSRCKVASTLRISNIGNEGAPSSVIQFFLSDDETFNAGDTFLKKATTGSLKAGATKTKDFNYSIKLPPGQTASGKYIIAVIDPDNIVTEGDKTNNTILYQIP